MNQVRINKFLSTSGVCSRRKADEHILAGDVTLNNKKAKLGDQVGLNDIVHFKGNEIENISDSVYIALYKPKGVISTADDELKRKSVVDILPKDPRVYPIGRLDKDSEGLLILTNDGDTANKLTHPKFEHEKEYSVQARVLSSKFKVQNIVTNFEKGLKIDDKMMKADRVYNVKMRGDKLEFNVTLHTGYNRQIRKMCDKIGLEVKKLTRIRIGNLKLHNLKLNPGEYKEISKSDIL